MGQESSNATGTVTDWLPGGTYTSVLVLVGVILFFFPEPLTSILGVLVLLAGIGVWLAGRIRS